MYNGYISIHRKILTWEWYDDANVFRLFIHCLLKANFQTKRWRGVEIKRGSFITSYPILAKELKLSIQNIRTALNKLKLTGELTVYKTADYSVISIKNYDLYQTTNSLSNSLLTGYQQSINSLLTTTNNDNKDNNDNNSSSSSSNSEIEFFSKYYNVGLTENQFTQLVVDANGKEKLQEIIEEFSSAIETGKEQRFSYDLPNAHFERLKSWIRQRKRNPNVIKFQSQPQESGRDIQMRAVDKVCKEWEEKLRKEGRLK